MVCCLSAVFHKMLLEGPRSQHPFWVGALYSGSLCHSLLRRRRRSWNSVCMC